MSRIKNAKRNIVSEIVNKTIAIVCPFIVRAVFIRTLGAEYLGLSGLFTSILDVLNLADLGLNTAIIYSMYAPIVKKESTAICALMNLYKKAYRVIGAAVLAVGLMIMPFLGLIIKGGYPESINIYLVYLIYLISTVLPFFLFAHKSALLTAHQRNDLVSKIQAGISIFQYVAQVAVLLFTKNYYLFAATVVITQVLSHVIINCVSNKYYPEYKCQGKVAQKEKKKIRQHIAGLMIHRICVTSRNSFDSIAISTFLGLNIVAIYSNYYSIMAAAATMMGIVMSTVTASVGNSVITETENKNYRDMLRMNFVYMAISGWIATGLLCLCQPVMKIWMGENYLLPFGMVVLFTIYFYALMMGNIRAVYSDANGLWYENRRRAVAESAANIILNFLLVNWLGLYGIIIGTLTSLLIINFGYGSQILFKHYFRHQQMSKFFIGHAFSALMALSSCALSYLVCMLVPTDSTILEIILKAGVCLIVPPILFLVFYSRTKRAKEAAKLVGMVIHDK